MNPILFDTSVWIDFFNDVRSKQTDLLYNYIADDNPVLLCPTIIQEILQGIKSDQQFQTVKQSLLSFQILTIDPIDSALGAAELFRALRKKGITIRRSNDCLIAIYALHFDVAVCHKDRDFDFIARGSALKVVS